MKFRVGPHSYRVRIHPGPLTSEGEAVEGLFVWSSREILISGSVPPRRRIDVLLHELRHAWRIHMGAPGRAEDDCNNAASFALDAMRQLQAQGGEPALMRLNADGVIDHSCGELQPAAPVGAECIACGGKFTIQQIVTEPAEPNDTGVLMVRRSLYCEFCNHVQEWLELATQSGQPTGQLIGGPRLMRGAAVEEFLSKRRGDAGTTAR